jgi:hypothetical protein
MANDIQYVFPETWKLFLRVFKDNARPKIIFQELYIVRPTVIAPLRLNEGQIVRTDILYTLQGFFRYIDWLPAPERYLLPASSRQYIARDNMPALRPMHMTLQAQSFPGVNDYPFHLIAFFISKNLVISQGR